VNDDGFRVLLQLGWGEQEVGKPWVGEEQHKERLSPAMAAAVASPCDFGAVAGSPVARWTMGFGWYEDDISCTGIHTERRRRQQLP
jgi:hypothetical protein